MSDIICNVIDQTVLSCNDSLYVLENFPLTSSDLWFWIYLGGYIGLVLMAGLMSGLTMGLLSLDLTSLKVLQEGGKPKDRKFAAKIVPLVKRHHWLLVTLLLANAVAVETMPLFLDRISDPVTAILVSVTAVLIFGEVFPQALCTRYGLAIGAKLSPLVYLLMGLLGIISFPIAKLLDFLLGEEHGTFYRRAELKVLVDMHGPRPDYDKNGSNSTSANEDPLTLDEVMVIKGALEMREKKVRDAMLPLDKVFMLSTDTCLNEATMTKILWVGHSRIPIYQTTPTNVIGVLLVKTLVCLNPSQGISLHQLIGTRCIQSVFRVSDSMPLFELLNEFQTGKSHLSIVYKLNSNISASQKSGTVERQTSISFGQDEIIGIITLEDVIEELIQEEILDEKDVPEGLLQFHVAHLLRTKWAMFKIPKDRRYHSDGNWTSNTSLAQVSPVGGIQCGYSTDDSSDNTNLDERTCLLEKSYSKSLP